MAHRGQRIAQPVPQGDQPLANPNFRSGASIRASHVRDQGQQHEGVTRPCAAMGKLVEQERKIAATWRVGRDGQMKHIMNQAQSDSNVNPLFLSSRILSPMTLCP